MTLCLVWVAIVVGVERATSITMVVGTRVECRCAVKRRQFVPYRSPSMRPEDRVRSARSPLRRVWERIPRVVRLMTSLVPLNRSKRTLSNVVEEADREPIRKSRLFGPSIGELDRSAGTSRQRQAPIAVQRVLHDY